MFLNEGGGHSESQLHSEGRMNRRDIKFWGNFSLTKGKFKFFFTTVIQIPQPTSIGFRLP